MVFLGPHGRNHVRAGHGCHATTKATAVTLIRRGSRVHLGGVTGVDEDVLHLALDLSPPIDVGQEDSILAELQAVAALTVFAGLHSRGT